MSDVYNNWENMAPSPEFEEELRESLAVLIKIAGGLLGAALVIGAWSCVVWCAQRKRERKMQELEDRVKQKRERRRRRKEAARGKEGARPSRGGVRRRKGRRQQRWDGFCVLDEDDADPLDPLEAISAPQRAADVAGQEAGDEVLDFSDFMVPLMPSACALCVRACGGGGSSGWFVSV